MILKSSGCWSGRVTLSPHGTRRSPIGNAAVLDAQLALLAQTLHATRLGENHGEGGIEMAAMKKAGIVSSFIVVNVRNWKG